MIGAAYEGSEVMNLGHPEYVRAAALAGLGYAALPLLAVREDIDAGLLTRLPIPAAATPNSADPPRVPGRPTREGVQGPPAKGSSYTTPSPALAPAPSWRRTCPP